MVSIGLDITKANNNVFKALKNKFYNKKLSQHLKNASFGPIDNSKQASKLK
jgi:hypothetical protein